MRTDPYRMTQGRVVEPKLLQVQRCPGLWVRLLAVVAGLALTSAVAWGQAVASGTVGGQVTDQGGAVVAGARVQLVDVDTKTPRSTLSNPAGRYDFVDVPPGVYDLTVTHPGFALARVPAQKVDVGLSLTLDVRLEVGTTSTTVDVTASAGAELQTLNATVGSTIAGDSLLLLPNLNRDVSSLSVLQVGVTPSGQVAGVQSDQNAFQVDGGSISDDMAGTSNTYTTSFASNNAPSGVVPTPIESVEEFKVNLSNQTADFNGAAGSQVQLVTKRGTNQFHGALYEYFYASNVGAANTWKDDHTPSGNLPYTPLPKTHRNHYGAALGGPLLPNWASGKTYFFGNFEGYDYPNATTVEKYVPTALMRAGVIQVPNSAGVYSAYNLNPYPVTVNGKTYNPATCVGGGLCDPRGLGLNSIVNQLWSKYMPLPNDPQSGDLYNTQGYRSTVDLPQTQRFGVLRLDHDFGARNHFTVSDRYYTFNQLTSGQVDIGGAVGSDTFGQGASTFSKPQKGEYFVTGLTTNITPTLTNDFHFNYLRNYWSWADAGGTPQLPGLGAALEIGGESSNALVPYNVDTQSTRQRAWDGHDQSYRDDLTLLHGNHFLQFGGSYNRNFDFYTRNDNGIATDAYPVYQVGSGSGLVTTAYQPAGLPSSQSSNWQNLYAEVLGIVSQPQVMYTRSGTSLTLNPATSPIAVHAIVPSYNFYLSDSWHIRPSLTLTYGLGYAIEMPPYELNGKQVQIVDQANPSVPLNLAGYMAKKQQAALAGQVYDPTVGFATVRNVGSGEKYPFDPFYGELSPRLAAAWNPNFKDGILGKLLGSGKTVVRGGYSRIYGRLNGGRVVGSPVLGAGLEQVDQCIGASITGQCLGINGVDPNSAFRIGTDGLSFPLPVTPTLPQPYYPGVNGAISAADGAGVDPKLRPDRSDQFNFTIQRALSSKLIVEAGYVGRIIRDEYNLVNIDAVPTMTTLGGQTFASAFANLYQEVSASQTITAQPFLETALGGAGSKYCSGYASCTAAVASLQKSAIVSTQVYNLWSALNAAPSWTLGRTLLASPAVNGGNVGTQLTSYEMASSVGFGNYNAVFLRFTSRDWHGLTAQSNFTWSRALGTADSAQSSSSQTVVDPWNMHDSYGPQNFDIRFTYNLVMLYKLPFFRGQHGVLGRVLGGWAVAPLFTAQSGSPVEVSIGTGSASDAQSYGEEYGNSNVAVENAQLTTAFTGGNSAHYNVNVASGAGVNGNPSVGGSGINLFANPNAVFSQFRPLILGYDNNASGAGPIRGFPTWNLDATLSKEIRATERVGATLSVQVYNALNHFQPSTPSLNIDSPQTWGVVTAQANTPRTMEFGLRVHF
ncbi:MAG: carboxypeptidase-like regulatory domain-containing protein [Bryobacteraceae bacterium]